MHSLLEVPNKTSWLVLSPRIFLIISSPKSPTYPPLTKISRKGNPNSSMAEALLRIQESILWNKKGLCLYSNSKILTSTHCKLKRNSSNLKCKLRDLLIKPNSRNRKRLQKRLKTIHPPLPRLSHKTKILRNQLRLVRGKICLVRKLYGGVRISKSWIWLSRLKLWILALKKKSHSNSMSIAIHQSVWPGRWLGNYSCHHSTLSSSLKRSSNSSSVLPIHHRKLGSSTPRQLPRKSLRKPLLRTLNKILYHSNRQLRRGVPERSARTQLLTTITSYVTV